MTEIDSGTKFGTWPDETSRLIYHDAMPALLSGTDTRGHVLDLGGGNGLAHEWFPNIRTVDQDASKHPHIVADILTYIPAAKYDRVLLRYVLHYLEDDDVIALMSHLNGWHHGELTIIQFVNDDMVAKLANSVNESKFFRTEAHLHSLLAPWEPFRRIAVSYYVSPDFYRYRLEHPAPTGHPETVVAWTCRSKP